MMSIKIPNVDNKRVKLSKGLRGVKTNSSILSRIYKENKSLIVRGGRAQGLLKISNLRKFKNYAKTRDFPRYDTTLLSAYIKFGCVSMREVYYGMVKHTGKKSELTRQLIWHDFYANLMNYLPSKRTIGGGNFKNKKINWRKNIKHQRAWESGQTGFPIVDAAMRQINTVGWMHNRSRLIVSNFLSLILHIDWHVGEKYFARNLVDYDVSSNNGNWQWSTGVGTDKTGYLRIYNPFNQSKDVDKDCVYIKKWIPELRKVPNEDIHNWWKRYEDHYVDYPAPIVDLSKEMKISKKMY
jgi:deoxyribodipyrimidine photo-lyase